jgi:fructan beta-fructosidase
MSWKPLLLTFIAFLALSHALEAPTYNEEYRPGYHYSCPKNWMNDPVGLVHFAGAYHMFYQYNPYDIIWGNMSWGHAMSTDLVHWQNLPVAIKQYGDVMIFSGSNIVDVNNTSGFCKYPDIGCLLAFYTAADDPHEAQAVAYSNDFGISYTQYSGNPIIDDESEMFRDPKVIWYAPGAHWVMVTAVPMSYVVKIYTSTNLLNWTHVSTFGPDGSEEGGWEDPDLYPLVDDKGNTRWVISHATAVNKVEYYIGDFNGTHFVNSETAGVELFIDYGRDFCEAASFNNEPNGRRLMIAWMDEGEYGGELPTKVWRGQLTLIRELTLRRYPEGLRVVQRPLPELAALRYSPAEVMHFSLNKSQSTYVVNNTDSQMEIVAQFSLTGSNTPKEFGLKVFVGEGQETIIGYKVAEKLLYVDRTKSGVVDFDDDFARSTNATLEPESGTITLRIFLDQSSVEVFANDGKIAMTNLIYPDSTKNQVLAYVDGGEIYVNSISTWKLNGIWKNAEDHLGNVKTEEFLSKIGSWKN